MRSPMIENAPYIDAADKTKYSDLKVMRSGAGWYVGTDYTQGPDDEFPGLVEPGSRDTEYMASKDEAEMTLILFEKMGPEKAALFMRMHP
jgi:hypothetical protein